MVIHHVPSIIPRLFKGFTWNKSRDINKIYLTFDDGPVPGVTDYVLDLLQSFDMKATFFMVGDNVRKYPQLAKRVINEGHAVGNHTFHHLNGFKTKDEIYLEDIRKCHDIVSEKLGVEARCFRPPYGRLKKSQYELIKSEWELIMWDVLSGDFDQNQSSRTCLEKTQQYTRNGSVIVFHDQPKAFPVLEQVLEPYLYFIKNNKYQTDTL
ncbi:polysaccharide deacetylase family protein [Belliella kenyensis]|uniref:Polysaccharide deacetylase family protein n=1 Tax=Belliella kenyensis TaxID=1472724 RepID=A0ABV8EMK6_9BACT|nr:polysaccharide deacetylase family protein [Belliella kenyensis]MCH7400730.1 polysaccharide deacetylase family protein [Belliella kenyensis]MDN3601983.1 polysaccharide deacetylase family protein [Belliella kenyensis]